MSEFSFRFGICLMSAETPQSLVNMATRCESLGYDSFWLAETYHDRGIMPLATLVGVNTSRIRIGLGVILTRTRHPALIAMEGGALDEIIGGRLLLGVGVGRGTAKMHAQKSTVVALRESLTIVRGLLDGHQVDFEGEEFVVKGTRLGYSPRKGIPLWVGCYPFSPKALNVAGERANGVLYVWTTPQNVRQGAESIAEGAIRAGRDPKSIEVGAMIPFSIHDNAAKAREAARPVIANYVTIAHTVWRRNGLVEAEDVDPVLAAFERGGMKAASAAVTDRLTEKIGIAGEPSYCRDRLREYEGTGLNLVVPYAVIGPDPTESVEIIAREFFAR